MTRLTRDAILTAKLATKEIEVEQWGGSVVIHEMPVARRNELLGALLDDKGNVKGMDPEIELKLFLAGIHDPPFTQEDVEQLREVSGSAVSFVAQEIMRFNGLTGDSLDDARGES